MPTEKMEIDYSSETETIITQCQSMLKDEKVSQVIELLTNHEKKVRLASDAVSTGKILSFMVSLYGDAKLWCELNEFLLNFMKKRGQLTQAVSAMVRRAIEYISQVGDKEGEIKLIETLRTVTSGKIYVEVERARLTQKLAVIRESEGDIVKAAATLQELHVETFGSMDKREKVEFILEQMRLTLSTRDFVKCHIISKKISTKYFSEADTDDLKLRFYKLMNQIQLHDKNYLAISTNFIQMHDTPSIKSNEELVQFYMTQALVVCLLAPHDPEQSSLLHSFKTYRIIQKLPKFVALLNLFLDIRLIQWDKLLNKYRDLLEPVFSDLSCNMDDLYQDMKKRCMEHNIRSMSQCYLRISLKRMAELLVLSVEECETLLAELVVKKVVVAKIDRSEGIVNFMEAKSRVDIIEAWSENLNELMGLINKTNHLIKKDQMVHGVLNNGVDGAAPPVTEMKVE